MKQEPAGKGIRLAERGQVWGGERPREKNKTEKRVDFRAYTDGLGKARPSLADLVERDKS